MKAEHWLNSVGARLMAYVFFWLMSVFGRPYVHFWPCPKADMTIKYGHKVSQTRHQSHIYLASTHGKPLQRVLNLLSTSSRFLDIECEGEKMGVWPANLA